MPPGRLLADDVASTEAERACLAALRDAVGEHDGPMERHCLRVFLIAERIATDRGHDSDREVGLCAAFLHDVGIYPAASQGGVYVTDGRRFAGRLLEPRGWAPERLQRCLDAIELHHELRSQWGRGAEVESIRLADRVEVFAGLSAAGVPRSWLRGVFRAVPRDGLYRELGRLVVRMARERPATMPGILRPGSGLS